MQDDTPNQPPVSGGTPPTPPTGGAPSTPPSSPPIVEDVPGISPTPSSDAPLGSAASSSDSSAPAAMAADKPKKSKKLLVILLLVVLVLAAGAAVLYFLVFSGGSGSAIHTASQTPAALKQTITATKSADLSEVCNGKKLSNAAEFKKPYRVASFTGYGSDSWYILAYFGDGSDNLSFEIDTANVIACLAPDTATATGSKECTVKDGVTEAEKKVTYKGVTQTLTFYNAKSGDKLQESKVVVDGDTCPEYSYTSDVTYAVPTNEQLEPLFTEFFAS